MVKTIVTSVGSVSLLYENSEGETLEKWIQRYNFPKSTITVEGKNYTVKSLKFKGQVYDFSEVTVRVFDWNDIDFISMTYSEAFQKYGHLLTISKLSPYCTVNERIEIKNKNFIHKIVNKLLPEVS